MTLDLLGRRTQTHTTHGQGRRHAEILFRVRPHHIHGNCYLCRIEVNKAKLGLFSTFKPSPSRNPSAFCHPLAILAMWQQSILAMYGNATTSFVNQLSGPLMPKVPQLYGQRRAPTSLDMLRVAHCQKKLHGYKFELKIYPKNAQIATDWISRQNA